MFKYDVVPLKDNLNALQSLDHAAIPPELYLTKVELEVLSGSESGFAILCTRNNQVIGGAYGIPEREVVKLILEVDPDYVANTVGI